MHPSKIIIWPIWITAILKSLNTKEFKLVWWKIHRAVKWENMQKMEMDRAPTTSIKWIKITKIDWEKCKMKLIIWFKRRDKVSSSHSLHHIITSVELEMSKWEILEAKFVTIIRTSKNLTICSMTYCSKIIIRMLTHLHSQDVMSLKLSKPITLLQNRSVNWDIQSQDLKIIPMISDPRIARKQMRTLRSSCHLTCSQSLKTQRESQARASSSKTFRTW